MTDASDITSALAKARDAIDGAISDIDSLEIDWDAVDDSDVLEQVEVRDLMEDILSGLDDDDVLSQVDNRDLSEEIIGNMDIDDLLSTISVDRIARRLIEDQDADEALEAWLTGLDFAPTLRALVESDRIDCVRSHVVSVLEIIDQIMVARMVDEGVVPVPTPVVAVPVVDPALAEKLKMLEDLEKGFVDWKQGIMASVNTMEAHIKATKDKLGVQ